MLPVATHFPLLYQMLAPKHDPDTVGNNTVGHFVFLMQFFIPRKSLSKQGSTGQFLEILELRVPILQKCWEVWMSAAIYFIIK